MIQRSFVFLERIGRRKEQNLWRLWDHFRAAVVFSYYYQIL